MRPCIICHMMASLDGRIDCAMTEKIGSSDPYYQTLAELGCPSMMEGRVTLAMHYALPGKYEPRAGAKAAGRKVYRAVQAPGYAVGVDTRGELLWGDNTKEQFGKPLLMLLSEDVGEDYLEYLRGKGISYVTVGKGGIDLAAAMEILYDAFGIRRLALVGGGHLNGSMLDLGLVDEVSMLYGAGIDGRAGMAAAFDGRAADREPTLLKFVSAQVRDGQIWARYKV
ncbi:MAG: dihydrofolate reductase family protein [Duodenibacillus sp.]|nr:dihydrofolate reductase family protein [Duodenibacillus sp.]